ncbi:MAG: phosphatase PAP2 family protein [Armatimonadetes bacterium]|nr:phosphatase PAP2 family protein [Armatimonadota bacterium]
MQLESTARIERDWKRALAWVILGLVVSAPALHAVYWATTQGPLRGLDLILLHAWHRATPRDSAFGLFLMGWSQLVSTPVIWPLLAFTSWIFWRKNRLHDAVGLVCAVSLPALVALAAKSVYDVARPTVDWAVKSHWSSAYPSGHIAVIFALCGLTCFLGWRQGRGVWWTAGAAVITLVATVLMGYSRVVLGAHFFSDVLGGIVLGFIWLAVSIAVTRALQPDIEIGGEAKGV